MTIEITVEYERMTSHYFCAKYKLEGNNLELTVTNPLTKRQFYRYINVTGYRQIECVPGIEK